MYNTMNVKSKLLEIKEICMKFQDKFTGEFR